MRLIDAEALLDDVMERYCRDCDRRKGIKRGKWRVVYEIGDAPCRACGRDDIMDAIENAPTIDPVKHGRWMRTPTWWAYCSVCGMEPPNESNETTAYCPNCGAKMDMDEDPSHPFADSVMMGERSESDEH